MASYRWTNHRVFDQNGVDAVGTAPISLWWVARAAAEETLQGGALTAAWLQLFRNQLSTSDSYWLRWQGNFAESAELRRAYSGLYGRYFARALLAHHLQLTRFLSLGRKGLKVPNSVNVYRTSKGDIPDWLAWDNRASRFVLCEAKGSLTSTDFMAVGGPKCVLEGKAQFGRVRVRDRRRFISPAQWVAATRWATDQSASKEPITVLWDPPADDQPFSKDAAARHRRAMTMAWLESVAPGFGFESGDQLLSSERKRGAFVVRVTPGPVSSRSFPPPAVDLKVLTASASVQRVIGESENIPASLSSSELYANPSILQEPTGEASVYEDVFDLALVTRFGVRPIRSDEDRDILRRRRDIALDGGESSMVIGLSHKIGLEAEGSDTTWLDDAGLASTTGLSVFDVRGIKEEII